MACFRPSIELLQPDIAMTAVSRQLISYYLGSLLPSERPRVGALSVQSISMSM